jgi:Leucine rich repeat
MKIRYLLFICITIVCFSLSSSLLACGHFQQLVSEGDEKLRCDHYLGAIQKYQAAITDCPGRAREAQERLRGVIDTMKMRLDAQGCKVRVLEEIIASKDSANAVLRELQRDLELEEHRRASMDSLVQAYEQILLASGGLRQHPVLAQINSKGKNRFCFIDATGTPVEKLGFWKSGTQFDHNGFARVAMGHRKYLLDSTGRQRRLPNGRMRPRVVTSIDLHEQGMRRFEKHFERKKNVEVLIANSNRFGRFPRKIKRLRHLMTIDFSDNRLRNIKHITRNRAMQRVNLEGNKIREICPGFHRLQKLRHLNLGRNRLCAFPEAILELKSLRELHLEYNQIASICPKIQNLDQLQVLDLSFNRLDRLPLEILQNHNLKTLGLTGNMFRLSKDKDWLAMIAQLKNLKLLRIGANPCSDTEAERTMIRRKMALLLPDCVVRFN